MNSTKIKKKHKLFDFEICYVKMKHTDCMFIKAIFESPTPPFHMRIRLVYTEGNVCNDHEKATLKYVSPFRK